MHSIQGEMRKRAIVVIRQPTIPVTDRYRLFLMRLGGAQPLLLILPWTPGAQGVMGAFLVLPPYPLPNGGARVGNGPNVVPPHIPPSMSEPSARGVHVVPAYTAYYTLVAADTIDMLRASGDSER